MSGALVPVERGAPVEVLPGVCDDTCRMCVFRGYLSQTGIICDFFGKTGQRRGCPAGRGCIRRMTGDKLRSVEQLIFLGKAEEKKRGRPRSEQLTPEEFQDRQRRSKAEYRAKIRAALGGRQAAVLGAYKRAEHLTVRELAERVGVSHYAVSKWLAEWQFARWDKLAALGIEKPEGLPEGLGRERKTT